MSEGYSPERLVVEDHVGREAQTVRHYAAPRSQTFEEVGFLGGGLAVFESSFGRAYLPLARVERSALLAAVCSLCAALALLFLWLQGDRVRRYAVHALLGD